MRDVIVFGAGQVAEVIAYYLKHEGDRRIAAYTVDGAFLDRNEIAGVPVIAFEEIEQRFAPSAHGVFVALSYRKLNAPRAEKLAQMRAKGYAPVSFVSPRAAAPKDFVAKANTFIMEHNTIQPFVEIGENVILWSGNHIGHHSRVGDNCFISSHVVISGGVSIGANTFIGVNATLRDNIKIGSHNVIGAGALILNDTEDYAVYPGVATAPAKVRADRLRG
jgi:sugar O-acyltransferase (sialic acid O-acetyltransferase NeuD family)